MHQVTADKFSVVQCNLSLRFPCFFTTCGEHYCIFRNRENPAVGDGDFMRVSSQVLNRITKAVKGLLDIRTPVLFIKPVFPFLLVIRIAKFFTSGRKGKGTVFIKGREMRQIFPLKFIPQHFRADEKTIAGFSDFSILGKPTAGNNAVHVQLSSGHPTENASGRNNSHRNVQICGGFCNYPWYSPAIGSKGLTACLMALPER